MTASMLDTAGAVPASNTTGGGTASGPTADQLAAEIHGAQMAVAAQLVVTQVRNSFTEFANNGFAQAAFNALPAFFLNSARQGSGVGSLLTPRILAVAGVTGVFIARDMTHGKHRKWVATRFVRTEKELAVGIQSKFCVDRFDEQGFNAPAAAEEVTFTSSHPHIAAVNKDGVVRGLELGTATITASVGDESDLVTVHVTEGHHHNP